MKTSVVVKEMLICQWFLISRDLDNGNNFVQSDLCVTILFNKLWKSSGEKLFAGEY